MSNEYYEYYAPIPFDPEDISERLEEMLNAMRWSWADLATKSGIDEATLRSLRTGEITPRVSMIHGLAEAVGITYHELTFGLARRSQRAPRLEQPPSSRRAA